MKICIMCFNTTTHISEKFLEKAINASCALKVKSSNKVDASFVMPGRYRKLGVDLAHFALKELKKVILQIFLSINENFSNSGIIFSI